MRFVMAAIKHETNTFSPIKTPLASFAVGRPGGVPMHGAEAVETFRGTNTPLSAFIDLSENEQAEIVLPVAAEAAPSGPVSDEAFDQMSNAVCNAVRQGCDAVFLDLHGAMVTASHSDGEGELLRRIRRIAPEVPIAVALDFHANLSPAMMENASVITGYRTYPHVDTYETGERCGLTLLEILKKGIHPSMVWGKAPMLTHTLCQLTSRPPLKDIMDRAIQAEKAREVINASVLGGFPLADIPHVGFSVVIVADDDLSRAEKLRDELLAMAWDSRAEFVSDIEPLPDSVARAKTLQQGPIVLVDHGDNVFSGGTQDVMDTLSEALQQGLRDMAAGPIWDPESVDRMIAAGVGSWVTLQLGGKTNMPAIGLAGRPLEVQGEVRCITDGRYRVTCPMDTGIILNHGRSVVLDTGQAEILVCSERMEAYDLGVFRHAGIEPTARRYLLIKSRHHFRAGFEPIARHIVYLAGPGVTASDYGLFQYNNIPRPIYPLDREMNDHYTTFQK
jgi:microcystin degradation protein MlrC